MASRKEQVTQPAMSEDRFSFSSPHKLEKSRASSPGGTAIEVYRNNTTAVEVIVKEVPNKFGRRLSTNQSIVEPRDGKVRRLQEEIENLKIDLNKTTYKLVSTRKGYSSLICELKKQLDWVSQKEIEEQTKNINLQLENEKLKALLDSKSRMFGKLKKEMLNMKRLLKMVVKGIHCTDNVTFASDPEYDDFEKGLKKDGHADFLDTDKTPRKDNSNVRYDYLLQGIADGTFDSSTFKDMNSFEK